MASLPYSVAVPHTVFNVITTLILVGFIPQLVKMVTWMVPNKGEEKETYRLKQKRKALFDQLFGN